MFSQHTDEQPKDQENMVPQAIPEGSKESSNANLVVDVEEVELAQIDPKQDEAAVSDELDPYLNKPASPHANAPEYI